MAYEAQGRELAAELKAQYGRLLEARLGAPIVLVFERGEWSVPSNFIFKFGYSGSGPDCFHAFLHASGFTTRKHEIEKAKAGEVFRASGYTPPLVRDRSPQSRIAIAPTIVPTSGSRPALVRLIVGLVIALIVPAFALLGAMVDNRSTDRERMNVVIGSILSFCFGSGMTAGALAVRSRHSKVTSLAGGAVPPVDAADIARQAGVSESLVRRWIAAPPATDANDVASRIKVRELQPKAAALEEAITVSTSRRIQIQALEAGHHRRLLGARRIVMLTTLWLASPILFLLLFVASLVLILPGMVYFAFLFFSEWDEFEANAPGVELSKAGAILTIVGVCLFPWAAGGALLIGGLAQLGFRRQLVIARAERDFIIGRVSALSLLRTRFESIELIPLAESSIALVESKKRTSVLQFTSSTTRRYIAVRTADGFVNGTREATENRARLLQPAAPERHEEPPQSSPLVVGTPVPIETIALPASPIPTMAAAVTEVTRVPSAPVLDETVHQVVRPVARPASSVRRREVAPSPPEATLRPGLSTAAAIGGIIALALFASVMVWVALRAPVATPASVASVPGAATPRATIAIASSAPEPAAPAPTTPAATAPSPVAPVAAAPPTLLVERPSSESTLVATPARTRPTVSRSTPNVAAGAPRPTSIEVPPAPSVVPAAPSVAAAAPVAPTVDTAAAGKALEAGARSESASDWEAALNQYRTARKLDPSLSVIVDLAIERVTARQVSAARDAFNRARQYDALGRADDAITWYERAVRGLDETDPNRATAMQRLAILRGAAR